MKTLLCLLILSTQAMAANFGKFKIIINTDWSSPYEATILLNSNGNILELENDNYMTIENSNFFGETTLKITSMGDEEFIEGKIILKNNTLVEACSAYVDGPNGWLQNYGVTGVTLLRWSKSQKKYVDLKMRASVSSNEDKCFKELTKDYSDYELL